MKMTVLCSDIPYPPNHGGRIDTWSRLEAFKKNGISLQIVVEWLPSEEPTDEQLLRMNTVANDVICVPRHYSINDYIRSSYPPRMYSFFPKKKQLSCIIEKVRSFSPDWLWLDGWHCYLLACALKENLNVRIAYRSHNVEHEYFRFQAEYATGIKKMVLGVNARRLRHAEIEIRQTADLVFDITREDAQSWGIPLNSGKWNVLPPLYIFPEKKPVADPIFDIAYIGNLWAPNNRQGLLWFIRDVLPVIRTLSKTKLNIVFAGASPHPSILEACRFNDITCIADPKSVTEYYAASKVLINPVLNASGINIKMLDMLASGKPIVSTPVAVRGLPNELVQYIKVALSAEEFAQHCVRSIDNKISIDRDEINQRLNQFFGVQEIKRALDVLIAVANNIENRRKI